MSSDEITSSVTTEELHKEIDLIQSCIARMAQNSFFMKQAEIGLYAVLLALLPEKVSYNSKIMLSLVLLTITLLFWYLDSFFLATEKNYRNLYSWVLKERPNGNRVLLYELNCNRFCNMIDLISPKKVAMTKTVWPFYLLPAIVSGCWFLTLILPLLCSCK